MEALKICALATIATVGYGIAHDIVTTRVSLEYFTIAHGGIYSTQSPLLLAFLWGVTATWWLGLLVGIFLALAARGGSRPKVELNELINPGFALIVAVGAFAMAGGIAGYIASTSGVIVLRGDILADIPGGSQHRFLAVAWAHTAAYGLGFVGATLLTCWIWLKRIRATPSLPEAQPVAHLA